MLCSYIYIGQYLYVNILLFLYLCFHICFYCSTSLFYGSGSVPSALPCFFLCKVMAALSDAKYQEGTPYLAKTFLEAFRK